MDKINLRYSTIVRWSEQDGEFVAVVPELPGISGVAASAEDALAEAREAAAAALAVLAEDGREAPPPAYLTAYSGQLRLRMPPSLHGRLTDIAELEGISLNSLILNMLVDGVARRLPSPGPHTLTVLNGGMSMSVEGKSA